MGWLVGYTIGSMAAALVVVRLFEAVTDPFVSAPSKTWRRVRSLLGLGRR